MALVKCPECGKEISDKSVSCIHCGFPIETYFKQSKPNTCNIDGNIVDLSKVYDHIPINKNEYLKLDPFSQTQYLDSFAAVIHSVIDINNTAAVYLASTILKTGEIPKEFDAKQYLAEDQKAKAIAARINQIHCPKCGSTSITTGARGINWTMGLIGASKTVNRCGNCGHTWKPKR